MNNITQSLIALGHQVKVLCINTPKYNVRAEELPADYLAKTKYESVYINTKINAVAAFINLLNGKSYHVDRFNNAALHHKLESILTEQQFDLIIFESLFVVPYVDTIRNFSNAKLILRTHNVEHKIWERVAETCSLPVKKWYLKLQSNRLKKYEISALGKFDGIATITKHDANYFSNLGCKTKIIDIPFGLNVDDYKVSKEKELFPSLFHLGSMDWIPNQEGIRWFLDNVWLRIYTKHPTLHLYLAGRNQPDWLINHSYPNVEVIGEVNDARAFNQSYGIMIVPLFSGSGIRIKIIEGMALGKTIITTSIGAEGINYTHGKDILIGNNETEIELLIDSCLKDKTYCDNIGLAARSLIEHEHNNLPIIQRLIDFYRSL